MRELYSILHAAFEREVPEGVLNPPSWRFLSDVATKQGVASVVNDGLQFLFEYAPDKVASVEKEKSVKYDLFGQCLYVEKQYIEQWECAKLFAEQLFEKGIRVFVLKGFAISQVYPVPDHRFCCDLDCYLMMGHSPAYSMGNRVSLELGYSISTHYYKHSKIKVGSLMVENHQFYLPVKGDLRSRKLNSFLFSIIDNRESSSICGTKLLSPSPMFNAIYVLAHAREHFLNECITLRHICDWGCLIKSLSSKGDAFWSEWKKNCKSFGLLEFGYSMSRLATKVCGIAVPFDCPVDNDVDDLVLEDIFRERPQIKFGFARRIQLVRNLLSSGWKFREFSDRSSFGFVFRRIWGFLIDKEHG